MIKHDQITHSIVLTLNKRKLPGMYSVTKIISTG